MDKYVLENQWSNVLIEHISCHQNRSQRLHGQDDNINDDTKETGNNSVRW
jgi:hypothetical protein